MTIDYGYDLYKKFYLKTIPADQAIDIRLINSRGEAIATQGESLVTSVELMYGQTRRGHGYSVSLS